MCSLGKNWNSFFVQVKGYTLSVKLGGRGDFTSLKLVNIWSDYKSGGFLVTLLNVWIHSFSSLTDNELEKMDKFSHSSVLITKTRIERNTSRTQKSIDGILSIETSPSLYQGKGFRVALLCCLFFSRYPVGFLTCGATQKDGWYSIKIVQKSVGLMRLRFVIFLKQFAFLMKMSWKYQTSS